jgi:S-formylglutathione hydrolase FrmB
VRLRLLLVAVLAGAVAAGGIGLAHRLRPGRVRDGSAAAHGATVIRYDVRSRYVHATLPQVAATPAGGGERRPLLVFLHGRGGDENSELSDEFYAALAEQGSKAPVIAFPYGGDSSYWHDRADGDWDRYVVDEVIPAVTKQFGADPKRVAIGGISMGGFGALDIALHHPGRFCAAGGHGPAIWQTGGETAAGAFDDAEDFAQNDLVGAAQDGGQEFTSEPLWLDAGTEDPFQPGDRAFAHALKADGAPAAIHLTWPGDHSSDYWNKHWDAYLGFYAGALANC